ncbi:RICIN domain-containing protein [Umezawaea sp. Da 62-37]|uniref:RICIN domain-containing protein n=1 Tax=Umezawaea sp. Da 62-37 TaxID=3075927 RepID=UPI0028F6E698|nr:RICIN domain-containing protein [Umezawaea sp. Da 62-37]WNV82992.1 RICIN domain-containing protein [Umezawaea sp. Da 62-37]
MRWNPRRLGAAALGFALAVGLAVTATAPASAESNGGVRVMPLGDSITDGFNVSGGYRVGLWQRMAAVGQSIDFVGSGFNGPSNLGDHDHEGHSGWRIDELDANVAGWIQKAAPRTILLHIGTNDIGQNHEVANAPTRLSALIDKIRVLAPSVELFVAQITPLTDAGREAQVRTFNAAIPGIVAQKGPKTHVVDMHTGFGNGDIADGIHPNAGGYDKMADRWYAALRSVPASLSTVVDPPAGDTVVLANPQSTRCLDVAGANTTEGTQVLLWDCYGSTNQRWTRSSGGELRIFGDRCLDVNANGSANGTKIQIWGCNGSPAQKFAFTANGAIVASGSGKCVDVTGNATANGSLVALYDCNNTGAQRWAAR